MGLLTRFMRGFLLNVLSLLTCDLLKVDPTTTNSNEADNIAVDVEAASNTNSNNNDESSAQDARSLGQRCVLLLSAVFDVLDVMNLVLDAILIVRLLQSEVARAYAGLLLMGLIFGRFVVFRATNVMFRGGIDWAPFWIDITYKSNKNKEVFAQLYCLLFSETAIFLFEDYPSLVVYAHWPVIEKTEPLDKLDNYNVGVTAATLSVLMALFLVAIVASLFLLQWSEWTRRDRCINATKIAVFFVGCAFLARYVLEMVIGAIEFCFKQIKEVPSNEVFFIPLCESETMETRKELCDERIFAVKVVIAWFIAGIFSFYILFRPATYAFQESFYKRSLARISKLWDRDSLHHSGNNRTAHMNSSTNMSMTPASPASERKQEKVSSSSRLVKATF